MKTIFNNIILGWLLLLAGCSQKEIDKGIKEMIGTTAKKEVAFAGVNYKVQNGVVTLTGTCPSETQKFDVEKKVKGTSGVKDVVDMITIAPLTLNGDFPLKQSVDSVLMKYPTVEGMVQDSVIIIQGEIEKDAAQKIIGALQSLHAKGLNNQLVVK